MCSEEVCKTGRRPGQLQEEVNHFPQWGVWDIVGCPEDQTEGMVTAKDIRNHICLPELSGLAEDLSSPDLARSDAGKVLLGKGGSPSSLSHQAERSNLCQPRGTRAPKDSLLTNQNEAGACLPANLPTCFISLKVVWLRRPGPARGEQSGRINAATSETLSESLQPKSGLEHDT